jgi:hypothetical protein
MAAHIAPERLWPFQSSSSTTVKNLEDAFRASLGLTGRLADHKASLASSGRFTPQGVNDEAMKYVKREVLPSVAKGHLALDRAKQHVRDSWARLTPKALDKTDAVGFLKRESIRDHLRSLHPEQRNAYLIKFADQLDPEIMLAALETTDFPWQSAEQKFISADARQMLTKRLIVAEHGDAIESIEALEKVIEYVEPTVRGAGRALQSSLAMNELVWKQTLQEESRKSPPVWLKRDGTGSVRVLFYGPSDMPGLNKDVIKTRAPTEADLANGVFYATVDEYREAVGMVAAA